MPVSRLASHPHRWFALVPLALAGALVLIGGSAGAQPFVVYPPPPPSPPPTMPSSVTVTTKSNPALGTILADGANGLTLYTLTNNGSPVLCTGTCASFWPPLTVPPGGTPPSDPPGVSGIGTTQNANGTAVTYQGFPLYGFAQDQTPADANGEGLVSFGGTWHVVALSPPAPCAPAAASPAPTGMVTRIAGPDRDATAAAASQSSFPTGGSAGAVVLASDANFPDALAGTPLAVAKHGPLLLTPPSGLSMEASTELGRVLAKGGTVYLLGGDAALSPSVDSQVAALGDIPQRIAGSDRFATAAAIAGVLGNPTSILEATGTDFGDALAAGAAAAHVGGAVLLTDGSAQSGATSAYLAAHPGDTTTAIGGPAAAADPGASSIVGSDRFATAVAVAQHFFSLPGMLGFASGATFPDALSGGAATAGAGGPLLLVPPCGSLPGSVSSYVSSAASAMPAGSLFGGTSAVGDDVLGQLDRAI